LSNTWKGLVRESPMRGRFTEQDTEQFYDSHDSNYREFWDKDGSLHWGVFDDATGNDFLKACANLNNIMAQKGLIDQNAQMIDLGCGNGNTSIWLGKATGCQVLGVDLSGVRVQNAKDELEKQSDEVKQRISFEKASVTDLPFHDRSFTHAWSQATIYHVPDKEKALCEAYRVLDNGGIFLFDDLIKPKPKVSDNAQKYVYDRLLFDTDFSFDGYQQALENTGFQILQAEDLSEHLKTSYACLSELAGEIKDNGEGHFQALAHAYTQMVNCIDEREVGWAMYVCRKVSRSD